jgi:hypothetical protein
MTRTNLVSVSRRALFATLLLAAASVSFGGESINSTSDEQLIGQMTVTAAREPATIGHIVVAATRERPLLGQVVVAATRERPLIGEMVVSATRLEPATLVADLGEMTVTAHRFVSVVRNDASEAELASL